MNLEYEEVLAPTGGLYRYHYVLSTERYSSEPLEHVSMTVNLRTSSGLASLYSSTHPVITERAGTNQATITWQAENVRPNEDFELFFAPAEGGFGGGLLTGQRNDQNHFLFLFSPEAEPKQSQTIPKDIVFVIDRSGSMSGEKIEQARNALHFILGQLNEADRFSIVGFDHQLSILAHSLLPVEPQTLADARRFVDTLTADGNTNLEAALQAGLQILDRSERVTLGNANKEGSTGRANETGTKIIIFLTDGLPTAGITDESLIAYQVEQANAQQEARLHVFGVGYDVNTHLLDRLAAENGGAVTYVQPGENLETALTNFYQHIAHPVLTDVTIEFEGIAVSDLYPQVLPDLFQGSSLLLTGRYQAGDSTVTVRVHGQAGNKPEAYVYHFDLAQTTGHDFVPRLWATRRVGELLDRVRVQGESQALAAEIQNLGLSYGLVTPYTTFIIEAQTEGAASADNMDLYDQRDLNLAWGQTTVQARVQNQAYQQATQANLASGGNVVNYGQRSLAQVAEQNVDLTLLQNAGGKAANNPITAEWLALNIHIDRTVTFGSYEYFALADDPAIRPFLQSGRNVVFEYKGEVIAVQAGDIEPEQQQSQRISSRPLNAFSIITNVLSQLWSR
jgi:Ca-activated chloride channel family protein